ncbi:MAG: PUA domain-containing protein [Nitrososphaerales archaeon]
MKIFSLSKRDTQRLIDTLMKDWPPFTYPQKFKGARVAEVDEKRRLIIFNDLIVVDFMGRIIPFLGSGKILDLFPRVVVDQGAIPFLCNGADVMRPGIIEFIGEFKKDDIIVVREVKYQKYIVVGLALCNSDEAKIMVKGAVVKNLHYVGDKVWEVYKRLEA